VQVGGFNANGIDATPNGKLLIIVQSATGYLFTVDPITGIATRIMVTGGDHGGLVPSGDGILLLGKTLYVVQNQLNKIAVIDVNLAANTGTVTGYITDPAFRVPTTIAAFGKSLYAVNARFGTPVTPTTDYDVVRVDK
jgi:sugar lactone lactonase YvrE